jgi:hypothetical protein
MRKINVIVFLLFTFCLAACRKSDSTSTDGSSSKSSTTAYQTSAQIGAAGGTISDPNGAWTFIVPAGALSETKTITVTTNAAATGSIPNQFTTTSGTLSFEPHGLTFLTPLTLKVQYAQGDMPEGGIEEKMQKQYYINDDSTVTAMTTTINTTTNELTIQVPHFSFSTSLTNSIKKVNNGTTTKASTVRNIANQVITYYNGLASNAARSADFNANWTLLYAFCQKLVAILGSDIVTAAFPNADWNLNSVINSLDPIVPISGASVTLTSSGSLYVSTNAGAINSTQFVWRSSLTGTYSIRLNGTTCTDGGVVASGAVTATVDNTYTPINASSLIAGDNELRVCVVAGGFTTFLLIIIARDEIYPTSGASPPGGTMSTPQNVAMSCLDTGTALCAQVAYSTNGSDPTFDIAGNVTNGTLYTTMWLTPVSGATTLKVRSRDDAGNVGVVATYSFTETTAPTKTESPASGSVLGFSPKINITFSETVTGALLAANYALSGSTGTLSLTGATFVSGTTYRLTFSGSHNGIFTITVNNVTDTSTNALTGNTMTYPAPTCTDGSRNGSESGVDCGGTCTNPSSGIPISCKCNSCAGTLDANCFSNHLTGGMCQPLSTCTNLVKDGNETDTDCGGAGTFANSTAGCAPCASAKICIVNADCASFSCASGLCE